jgi:hypothetical protein
MINAQRSHQHNSSGANRPSDVAVTVIFNAEFTVMPDNPIIECFSKDLVPDYCQGLEASTVSTAPPFVVELLHGHSIKSLPRLLLNMHAENNIPTFLTSNINIGLYCPKPLTMTRLWLYETFEVLPIVGINNSVILRRNLNFHLLRDALPYRLARGMPLKEGVLHQQNVKWFGSQNPMTQLF